MLVCAGKQALKGVRAKNVFQEVQQSLSPLSFFTASTPDVAEGMP